MNNLFQKSALAACLMAGVLVGGVAQASSKLIDGNNPQAILEIAKGFGSAELGKDGVGDPQITGRIDGIKYGIYFYACTSGKDCGYMQFVTGYETDGKTKLSDVNKWNNEYNLGRVMLDEEDDVVVDYHVMLHKGVSKATIEESFEYWRAITSSVEDDLVD